MDRRIALLLLPLALAGCGRKDAEHWERQYKAELQLHQKTIQIKNAEVAARDLEAESQRAFMLILTDRINTLEQENRDLRKRIDTAARSAAPSEPRVTLHGKVTAVATEIQLAVINLGQDDGLRLDDVVYVTREGRPIATIVLDRVDKKWSAGKCGDRKDDPKVGDLVSTKK
jgi:hypothetical protein